MAATATNYIEQAALPRLNSRPIARARYEKGLTGIQRAAMAYVEILKFIAAARLEWSTARRAVEMCLDDLDDRFASETISWCEDPASPYAAGHAGSRGRCDLTDLEDPED